MAVRKYRADGEARVRTPFVFAGLALQKGEVFPREGIPPIEQFGLWKAELIDTDGAPELAAVTPPPARPAPSAKHRR